MPLRTSARNPRRLRAEVRRGMIDSVSFPPCGRAHLHAGSRDLTLLLATLLGLAIEVASFLDRLGPGGEGALVDGPPIRKDLRKWIPMAAATGVLAGLCAAAFYWLLHVCTRFVLGSLTGYRPATVAADGAFHQAVRPAVGWAVPLVVAGGAFVGTALVLFFAPEAAGHGSDDAIRAAHEEPGRPRVKVGVVKLLASAITIGSGGSGGSEGPIAQISAAFAPLVSRLFRLPDRRAKQVLAIGMGAGIGAIFRTPLAGALLGAELLYVADFEAAVIVPGLIASTVAFGVFGLINGFDPFLGRVAPYHWPGLLQFLVFPAIGLVCG